MEKYTYELRKASVNEIEEEKKEVRDPFSVSITSNRGGFLSTIADYAGHSERKFPYKPVYSHRDKIKIIPEKMEKDVFYIVSYKGEKFAVRKLDEYKIEFREVIE